MNKAVLLVLGSVLIAGCAIEPGDDLVGSGGYGGNVGAGGAPPSGTTGAGGDTVIVEPEQVEDAPAVAANCEPIPGSLVRLPVDAHASTAAAQYARASLLGPRVAAPAPALLRAEDFLSYYAVPAQSQGLALSWFADPFVAGGADVTSGVLEVDVMTPPRARPPLRLVVLVDASPSLEYAFGLEVEALRALARGVVADHVPGDEIVVLSFGDEVHEEMAAVIDPAQELGGLPLATYTLVRKGTGNDLAGGIRAALDAAAGGAAERHVLVLSDGATTITDDVVTAIEAARATAGTRLSAVQVAPPFGDQVPPFAFQFLDRLASAGGGSTFYLADALDAERALERNFGRSFGAHGSRMTVQIRVPPLVEVLGPTFVATFADVPQVPGFAVTGTGSTYAVRAGLRAGCAGVLDGSVELGPDFRVELLDAQDQPVFSQDFSAITSREEGPLLARTNAVLATVLALRSRTNADIAFASSRIDVADAQQQPCEACKSDLDELRSLLAALAAAP